MKPLPLLTQCSSLCDVNATARIVERVAALADRLGLAIEPISLDASGRRQEVLQEEANIDGNHFGLLFLILTGGSEGSTLQEVCKTGATSVGLVAHPEFNSLPAALEIAAYLGRKGVGVRLVQLSQEALQGKNNAAGVDNFVGLLQAFNARRQLAGGTTRLGVLGDPSPWLLTSLELDEARIQQDWGVELVRISMKELQTEIERTPTEAAQSIAEEIIQNAEEPSQPPDLEGCATKGCGTGASCHSCCGGHGVVPEHVTEASRVFKALEAVVERNQVTSFTIRCFDLLERPVVAGCLAVSLMNDKGIVAGCEGDVHAAITMLLARAFVPKASFLANPVEIDVLTGRVLLCHCTIARTLCASYSLDSHFESGLSVSIAGNLHVPSNCNGDRVTIARVDATSNLVFAAEGTVDHTYTKQTNQCRTQVMVKLALADARAILDHPLGNHHVLIVGSCAAAFHAYAKLFVGNKFINL